MFRKITIAFDESPEAGRALQAAVELAKSLHASLTVISVIEPAPIYFSFSALAKLRGKLRSARLVRYRESSGCTLRTMGGKRFGSALTQSGE